jgi:hypothetical protein
MFALFIALTPAGGKTGAPQDTAGGPKNLKKRLDNQYCVPYSVYRTVVDTQ